MHVCSICCEPIVQGGLKTHCVRPHYFHVLCLGKWLVHNDTCPMCRGQLGTPVLTKLDSDRDVNICVPKSMVRVRPCVVLHQNSPGAVFVKMIRLRSKEMRIPSYAVYDVTNPRRSLHMIYKLSPL